MIIAIAQIDILPGKPMQNAKHAIEYVKEARVRDPAVRLVLFPELTIPGYLLGDMWEEQAFLRECKAAERIVREFAVEMDIFIVFGTVSVCVGTQHDGRPVKFNSLIIATPSGHTNIGYIPDVYGDAFIPKTLLPNYREFDEPRHFSALSDPNRIQPITITDVNDGEALKIGFALCEDGWDADYNIKVMQILADKGANLLINHSCSPFTVGKNGKRNRVFGAHAKNAGVPLIYVNSVGLQNNGKTIYTFDGCSVVYSTTGEVVHESPMFKEDIFLYDTEAKTVEFDLHEQGIITQQTDIGDIYQAIVYGIRKYCEQSGIKQVVIGSSGGVDSAVSAALHVDALGSENVFLVNMPSRYNSDTTKNLSEKLADSLGCQYWIVPIQDAVDLTIKQVEELQIDSVSSQRSFPLVLSQLNSENIQARDRSARVLAAIASSLGAVFSNNGNKSECMVGYATLYGDVAGYMAPIADLWKEQIYLLGKYINHIHCGEVIPEGIFNIVACAELSDDQKVDEGKGDPLVFWYHDRLFRSWQQDWNRKTPEEILEWYDKGTLAENLDFPKNEFGEYKTIDSVFPTAYAFIADLERWWKLFKGMAVAKRIQAPPVLAVSKRAFGFDYRESLNCCMFTTRYYELVKKLTGK